MESIKAIELVNVQKPEGLTGLVNSQVQAVLDIVDEAVNQKSEREQRLELLEELRISSQTEVEPEKFALSVDGVGFFGISDLAGLKGKQKAGKGACLKVCLAALLGGKVFRVKSELTEPLILYGDTEQKGSDVQQIVDEAIRLSGRDANYVDEHLFVFSLRRRSYEALFEDVKLLIETYRPQVVIIDGLVDMIRSFNDEPSSRELIKNLMLLCEEHECSIVAVLHENKSLEDANMRGHLGTVLAQKAGSVLQCQKLSSGVISVSCPDARHGTMPEWHIAFDEKGHIVDADELFRQQQEERQQERAENSLAKAKALIQERVGIMQDILREAGGYLTRTELKNRLMEKTGLKDSRIYEVINSSLGTDIVEKNGFIYLPDEPDLFT